MLWPATLLAVMAVCAYFMPKRYVAVITLKIRTDSISGPAFPLPPVPPAPIPWRSFIPEHFNPLFIALLCTILVFPVGYALLLAGVVRIIRRADLPPEAS